MLMSDFDSIFLVYCHVLFILFPLFFGLLQYDYCIVLRVPNTVNRHLILYLYLALLAVYKIFTVQVVIYFLFSLQNVFTV